MAIALDIHPNGFAQRLCDGMVRARFREGMEQPTPIEPGRIYRYEIDCWATGAAVPQRPPHRRPDRIERLPPNTSAT